MITDLVVEGYQSLRRARLRPGRFTVVTGPTSSGKSSLIRAARLLAFNAKGTAYITQGQGKCVVGAGDQEEGWAASLARGRGADAYRVSALDPEGGEEPRVWEYTKLGGKVPGEVSELLRLSDLNFAGQFDGPFLLAESAGEVARVLGRLTNVTLVFRAAQEAGRRKKALAADLRAAEREEARLRSEAGRFTGLRERLGAVTAAEEALERLAEVSGRAERQRGLLSRHSAAERALGSVAVPPEPPGLGGAEEAARRAGRLRELSRAHRRAQDSIAQAEAAVAAHSANAGEVARAIQLALAQAGQCPTCGQQVGADGPGNGTRQARADASSSGA